MHARLRKDTDSAAERKMVGQEVARDSGKKKHATHQKHLGKRIVHRHAVVRFATGRPDLAGAKSGCAARRWDAYFQHFGLGPAAAVDTFAAADSPAAEADTGLVAAVGRLAVEHTDHDCCEVVDRRRHTAAC